MKTTVNLQKIINYIGAVLIFTVLIAFLMAGYYVATGNFHHYPNL